MVVTRYAAMDSAKEGGLSGFARNWEDQRSPFERADTRSPALGRALDVWAKAMA